MGWLPIGSLGFAVLRVFELVFVGFICLLCLGVECLRSLVVGYWYCLVFDLLFVFGTFNDC